MAGLVTATFDEVVLRRSSMRCRTAWILTWLLLACGTAGGRSPNVILVVADDLGYAELGCYGQQWIATPHLDQLAREGMRFTEFYAGNAVCAPSRCCLLTGRHPGHAAIRDNGDPRDLQHLRDQFGWQFPGQHPLPDDAVTLPEILRARGYATAAVGKWGLGHFGTTGDPNRQGVDLFYGYNCQRHAHNHYPRFLWRNREKELLPGNDRALTGQTFSQDRFTEVALQFIRDHREHPFFLYLPLAIPHLSIQVPESSLAQYRDRIPEEPYDHRDGYLRHPFPRAGYAAMISHMDRDVGQIMTVLRDLDLDDDTLVLFTSDNGPTYGRLGGSDSRFFRSAAPFRGLKGSLYEGGIRVPLLARWPGQIPAGAESDVMAAFWDLLPTIAEFVGAELPAGIDGISLAHVLRGRAEQALRHDYLYWEFPGYGGQQAVRQGNWKAIRQQLQHPDREGAGDTELYDLASDAGEQHDMADRKPAIVERLERILREAHTPSPLFPIRMLDARP
jgi:arylsulfatase